MKKVSKIVLILAILMGVLFMQSQVQASIVINSTPTTGAGNNNVVAANNAVTSTNNATTTSVTTNNTTTNNTVRNNTVKNNTTNTLPKTGIEDSPAGIIMIIGAISAIYAYKKIREYNV